MPCVSQISAVPLAKPAISREPSGENASPVTWAAWPSNSVLLCQSPRPKGGCGGERPMTMATFIVDSEASANSLRRRHESAGGRKGNRLPQCIVTFELWIALCVATSQSAPFCRHCPTPTACHSARSHRLDRTWWPRSLISLPPVLSVPPARIRWSIENRGKAANGHRLTIGRYGHALWVEVQPELLNAFASVGILCANCQSQSSFRRNCECQ